MKRFPLYLREDTLLREWLWRRLREAHVSSIEIERSPNTMNLIIRTSRPGILIGRGGEGILRLKQDIAKKLSSFQKKGRPGVPRHAPAEERRELKLTVEEVRSPETDARIVAEQIRDDIEKRIRFRRILTQTVEKVRVRTLGDGTTFTDKVTKFVKAGEPRYSVDGNGTLIAHYLKRGGVGRKFVYQFKRRYLDTPQGRERRNKEAGFRGMLKANGIPGA